LSLPARLQAKRIGILGAGREGQAAYHWLKTLKQDLSLQLFAETAADPAFLAQLGPDDVVHVGSLDDAQLEDFDVLLRSPGITPYRPALQRALNAGVQLVSPSSLWFAANPGAKTICITGTKGKSTTSALVTHMLEANGFRVQLAGNIGKPLLACDTEGIDWWVIELSSYQLSDLEAQPVIGVILNISPEHLDWHGGVDAYMRDKLRLAKLAASGRLILNQADPVLAEKFAANDRVTWFNSTAGIRAEGRQFYEGDRMLDVAMPVHMPGKHNRSNVAAALSVIREVGADLDKAIRSIQDYKSLPHRLQLLGERNGTSWINDSISSTPVATAAALESLAGKSVILLLGGLDRGIDWSSYLADFRENVPKAIIAMPDNGPAVLAGFSQAGLRCPSGHYVTSSLEEAVEKARQLSSPGDIVLLSPGAPSFPRFVDFQHRGNEFARLAGF